MIWDQARKGNLVEVARILQNDGHDIVCQPTALFQTHVDQLKSHSDHHQTKKTAAPIRMHEMTTETACSTSPVRADIMI
jgi:hypothetical protein